MGTYRWRQHDSRLSYISPSYPTPVTFIFLSLTSHHSVSHRHKVSQAYGLLQVSSTISSRPKLRIAHSSVSFHSQSRSIVARLFSTVSPSILCSMYLSCLLYALTPFSPFYCPYVIKTFTWDLPKGKKKRERDKIRKEKERIYKKR